MPKIIRNNKLYSGGSVSIDRELSTTSTNPVQNKVITEAIGNKVDKDGNNATGTWSININGKATNASTASYATKAGSATSATNADTATYATKAGSATSATTATNAGTANYATKAGTANYATSSANASTANYATKAIQDENGDNIVNTYAKKSSVLSTLTECEASTNNTDIASAMALGELKESLTTPRYQTVTINEYDMTIMYRKVFNMVELNFQGSAYNFQPGDNILLYTLPEEYRPLASFPIPEGYGKPDVRFYIGRDGNLILQNVGTQPKSYVAAHCVYLV